MAFGIADKDHDLKTDRNCGACLTAIEGAPQKCDDCWYLAKMICSFKPIKQETMI